MFEIFSIWQWLDNNILLLYLWGECQFHLSLDAFLVCNFEEKKKVGMVNWAVQLEMGSKLWLRSMNRLKGLEHSLIGMVQWDISQDNWRILRKEKCLCLNKLKLSRSGAVAVLKVHCFLEVHWNLLKNRMGSWRKRFQSRENYCLVFVSHSKHVSRSCVKVPDQGLNPGSSGHIPDALTNWAI